MSTFTAAKRIDTQHNVWFRVVDPRTRTVVQEVSGHNAATNSMLTGIAHYLMGDGILNQGFDMLSQWVPRFMSLGTMGLCSQDADEHGLPIGIGSINEGDPGFSYESAVLDYIQHVPGYGADGYDPNANNERDVMGLGLPFSQAPAAGCELISDSFPRAAIGYREILPETRAELPHTLDIIYSGLVSTGALAQFRGDADHIFISEAGLWSRKTWTDGGDNGLLAGYRMVPPDIDISDHDDETPEERAARFEEAYRKIQSNVLRVGINQVVQIVWKIQLGGIDQLVTSVWEPSNDNFYWYFWAHADAIMQDMLAADSEASGYNSPTSVFAE